MNLDMSLTEPMLLSGISYGNLSSLLAKSYIDHHILNPCSDGMYFRDTIIEVDPDNLRAVKRIVGEPVYLYNGGLVYFGHHEFNRGVIVPEEFKTKVVDSEKRLLERTIVRGYSGK